MAARTHTTMQLNFDFSGGMRCFIFVLVCALLASPVCLVSSGDREAMDLWRSYKVKISNFTVEYSVPSNLLEGYGGQLDEVKFEENMERSYEASRFGRNAYSKPIATFYYGLVGDFRDWVMTVNFLALRFPDGNEPLSEDDLLHYLKDTYGKPRKLKTGAIFFNDYIFKKITIEDYNVVIAASKNDSFSGTLELMDGAKISIHPRKDYFIRLNRDTIFLIRVSHYDESRLTTEWYGKVDAMIASIIEKLEILHGGSQSDTHEKPQP